MAKYWIKLYHEILQDRKMARLPDPLWRRVVEIFLLAGADGAEGLLPSVEDMAWELRVAEEQLQIQLEEIAAQTGIIELTQRGWIVVNFEKRQAASSAKERMRAHRAQHNDQGPVTNRNPQTDQVSQTVTDPVTKRNAQNDEMLQNVTDPVTKRNVQNDEMLQNVTDPVTKRNGCYAPDTELETETDLKDEDDKHVHACAEKWSRIQQLYQENITLGLAPLTIREMQQPDYLDLPYPWWQEAIQIAAENNVPRWPYIRAVLDRSKQAGRPPRMLGPPQRRGQPQAPNNSQQRGRRDGESKISNEQIKRELAAF